MSLRRSILGIGLAALLAVSVASPAFAYGKENWQIAFSGTGVAPAAQNGFGFWGWCAFGGGVTSGTNGDCEFSQYVHTPTGNVTCEVSLDISSWTGAGGTFVISGTATVHPSSSAGACLAIFPGSASFTGVNTGFPAAAGHYNFGSLGPGLKGQFMVQVAQIP
jgi:hypothetical protein